jgi:DGQHR domain-containing protein
MDSNQAIKFTCLKCKQPIGEFYTGVMNCDDLIKITYVYIRRLETGDEKRDVEIYSGIQRELSTSRVKEISKYVNTVDATFPTGVILHINQNDCTYDEQTLTMTLPFKDNIAKVIDGQHRIAGLENYNMFGSSFQINVVIFVQMDIEDQAIVFATINKTQTKVNKSLVADLFEFTKNRSPQKTAHNIVRALNEKRDSPFEGMIKILGTANDAEKETITQAIFTDALVRLMSKDPMTDRDLYKRGKRPEKFVGRDLLMRPMRNLFIDEKDAIIAKIIWEYFKAVQMRWPNAWNKIQPKIILNKSTGFSAFVSYFRDAYVFLCDVKNIGMVIEHNEYAVLFEKVKLEENMFNRDIYIPGDIGQKRLYTDLLYFTQIPRVSHL